MIFRRIKATLSRLRYLPFVYEELTSLSKATGILDRRLEFAQEAIGRIESRQSRHNASPKPMDHEFRVFSQWGEDGIIQFLLSHLNIERKIFVEFGADNYNLESNTRFLLTKDNWAGLVIDSSEDAIRRLRNAQVYWLYNLKAVQAFITRDNINELLVEHGIVGDIGLLSIDIDGNDYWIWRAIDVIRPAIVIIEYNHRFGSRLSVTIPYQEDFDRYKAHPSRLYFGASLKALCILGARKGYSFVGCNSNGVNAFFVRNDLRPETIKSLSVEEGYAVGGFGEKIEQNGDVVKLSPAEENRFLMKLDLPLVNIETADE